MTVEELFSQIKTLAEIKTAKAGTIVRDDYWNVFIALFDTPEPPKQGTDYKQPIPEQDKYYLYLTWQQFNQIKEDMAKKTTKPGNSGNAPGHNKDPETGKPTKPVTPAPVPTPEIETPTSKPTPEPEEPVVVIPPIVIPEVEKPADVIVPVGEPVTDTPKLDPIFKPLPEEPAAPQVEQPRPEPQPEQIETKPLPDQVVVPDPTPITDIPAGQKIKGDITHLVQVFHADVGPQIFDALNDGNTTEPTQATNYDMKLKLQNNLQYHLVEPRANAKTEYIDVYHGKHTNTGIKYHAYLKNGSYVENIFGNYTPKANSKVTLKLKAEHQNLLCLVQETANTINTRAEGLPAEIDFFGEADNYIPKPYLKTKIPIEKHIGCVIYDWNALNGSGRGLNQDKMKMLVDTAAIVRWYSDTSNKYRPETKSWCFNPANSGGWKEDEMAKAFHDNNIDAIYCLKGDEATPYYVDGVRQVAIRWGSNKNVDPKLINIYTDPAKNTPTNQILVGMGWLKKIQFGNERNRWWKGRADVKNQINLVGFVDAFEHCAQDILCYNAVKEIDPTIEVVMSGMALTNPGYIQAMAFYAKYINKVPIYGGNKVPWDSFAAHMYNNEKGGQRQGAVRGLPPEQTKFGQNIERLLQIEFEIHEDDNRAPGGYVTEHGYSHSTGNPEQTAYAIAGLGDRFEVAGIWTVRSYLSAARRYLTGSTVYQQRDDTLFKQRPNAPDLGWDLSNGQIDETISPEKRRATADYNMQLLSFIRGYCMTVPGDEKAEVVIDKLEKPGNPDLYAIGLPSIKGATKEIEFNIAGAKSYTISELRTGMDKPYVSTVPATGKNKFVATEKTMFIHVNK